MTKQEHILVINPGSTSTKLAIFAYDLQDEKLEVCSENQVNHAGLKAPQSEQLEIRYADILAFLASNPFDLNIIMARGAPLRPLNGGTYLVNDLMLDELKSNKFSHHASNLAALLGDRIGKKCHIPVYITDPVTTDEFEAVARISGVPGIERKSRSHALNIKASLRKLCLEHKLDFAESSWVVCHMGGGISVAAISRTEIIDVNDALLGMGPFSAERAGAIPLSGLLDLAFSPGVTRASLEELLSKNSGLKGYLGTADLQEVESRIKSGDERAELIFQAMVYQISKEIGAMASVLEFQLDGILLTGGMAHSAILCQAISQRVQAVADIFVVAGENEMEALAQAAGRILSSKETVKTYG